MAVIAGIAVIGRIESLEDWHLALKGPPDGLRLRHVAARVFRSRAIPAIFLWHLGLEAGTIFAVMQQPIWNFEQEPFVDERPDETSINLRAYMDRMPDEKMRQYSPSWTDEQVIAWCDDFKDDGTLLMACCERDVDVTEFRRVLAQAIVYRDRVRPALAGVGK